MTVESARELHSAQHMYPTFLKYTYRGVYYTQFSTSQVLLFHRKRERNKAQKALIVYCNLPALCADCLYSFLLLSFEQGEKKRLLSCIQIHSASSFF